MPHCYTSSPLKNAHFYWTYIVAENKIQHCKCHIAKEFLFLSFSCLLFVLKFHSNCIFLTLELAFGNRFPRLYFLVTLRETDVMQKLKFHHEKNITISDVKIEFFLSASVFATQISSHDLIATLAWKLHFSFQTPNLDLNQDQFYYVET